MNRRSFVQGSLASTCVPPSAVEPKAIAPSPFFRDTELGPEFDLEAYLYAQTGLTPEAFIRAFAED